MPRRKQQTAPAVTTPKPEFWTSDEWATPPEEVEALAGEFGPFDLDPCARADTTKAPLFYTKDDNGLALEWFGRVWLNPPYSDPGAWLEKAVQETKAGHCDLVVALLPASTDTGWFHDLVTPYAEIRFRRGRIKFLGWEGTPIGSPKAGTLYAIYRAPHIMNVLFDVSGCEVAGP